ncbi:MAG TPA: STAS domain-containing protein [Burkholderiaceae bacterium]|nr:STAS domain-containing protein [Burkholderiaceae bacterium]
MQFATHRYAEALVAQPAGRIDHTNAAAFEGALAPLLGEAGEAHGALVLDFSAVEYISSVGLRVLMIAAKQMREQRTALVVAAAQPVVAEIFAISRFDKVLTLAASVEEALGHCSAAARAARAESRP